MKEIYKYVVGYYDNKENYYELDNSFKFYQKLSIGKSARYKNIFYNGNFIIKGRTKVRCICADCGVEKELTMNSLKLKEDKKYQCQSCANKGKYFGRKANENRTEKSKENYLKDFGEITRNWLYQKYIIEKKSLSQISQIISNEVSTNKFHRGIRYIKNKLVEYNIPVRGKEEYMKIPSTRERNIKNGSKGKNVSSLNIKTMEVLDKLNIKYEKEYILGNYRYDLFIPDKNIIIECNGDYWHCNPNRYPPNFFHKHHGVTAEEKWKKDEDKINFAKNKGHNVLIYWEGEINSKNYLEEVRNGLEV